MITWVGEPRQEESVFISALYHPIRISCIAWQRVINEKPRVNFNCIRCKSQSRRDLSFQGSIQPLDLINGKQIASPRKESKSASKRIVTFRQTDFQVKSSSKFQEDTCIEIHFERQERKCHNNCVNESDTKHCTKTVVQ